MVFRQLMIRKQRQSIRAMQLHALVAYTHFTLEEELTNPLPRGIVGFRSAIPKVHHSSMPAMGDFKFR